MLLDLLIIEIFSDNSKTTGRSLAYQLSKMKLHQDSLVFQIAYNLVDQGIESSWKQGVLFII
jgi:hypothetical protein